MKATILSVAAVALLQLTSAQPHRRRHQALHEKRDVIVEIIEYVDELGNVISVETSTSSSSAPEPTFSAAAVENIVEVSTSSYVEPSSTSVYVEPTSSSTSSETPAATSAPSVSASGMGITYSPYKASGNCKTAAEVLSDFDNMSDPFGKARIYGLDCNQVSTVLAAVKAHNMKLMIGIFDISDMYSAIETIKSAVGNDWSYISDIAVGNELVNGGTDPAVVIAAIGTARSLLAGTGFSGSIITIDTLVAMREHPELCLKSDYCGCNCHPFFDANVVAKDSGDFILAQIADLASVVGSGKTIVVTETGWPSQGDTNGVAVPSSENQKAAIDSIKSAFSSNPSGVMLFTAFNDHWKQSNSAQFNAEPWWGIYGDSSTNY